MQTDCSTPLRMTKVDSKDKMNLNLIARRKAVIEQNPKLVQGSLRYTLADDQPDVLDNIFTLYEYDPIHFEIEDLEGIMKKLDERVERYTPYSRTFSLGKRGEKVTNKSQSMHQ